MAKNMLPRFMLFGGHVLPGFAFVEANRVYQLNPRSNEFSVLLIFDPGNFHLELINRALGVPYSLRG